MEPVYAGNYIEVYGKITNIGKTSCKMAFEARKAVSPRIDINNSAADFLQVPIVVCKAIGTCVVSRKGIN
ncbi:hypothetical protein KM801_03500 [Clostridium tyrobutyricum]|jgi:3-aminobutyryl-CoA ammonia-lyase|nr:hypothetical protein [Clostridium tyrobutyricum]MBV4421437.1 hypothetical protein [Clostridium tyrobutyricum]MBV4424948.1 hypothetical protein [Clostridium tyrobutyricum]MBV4427217.1 hypothetical protein [Clostridium tyrobutyricum]MBV4442448.1 hypothetical protein [Clostridium tyrobutyricum]